MSKLRKDIMLAKKDGLKDKAAVLSAILDNAQKFAKAEGNREVIDSDIIVGVKREVKMAEQSKAAGAPFNALTFEIAKSFLPKQMSERELRTTIESIINDIDKPNMGLIMKELKTYGELVDMKLASGIIKELLI